jgi:hypothetical protein
VTGTEVVLKRDMKIRLTVGDTFMTATLNNSKTTQDFLALLPLTLTLHPEQPREAIQETWIPDVKEEFVYELVF